MRVVLDTNVIISATLRPAGPAGRLLDRFVLETEQVVPVVDARIFDEYGEVLARPKFRFLPAHVDAVLAAIEAVAIFVDEVAPIADTATPLDDRPFLDVAVAGNAVYLVTGNAKHFTDAATFGVDIISPGDFVRLLEDD